MATLTLAALYVTGAGCAAGKDDDPAATATAGIGSQTQTSTGVGGQGGQGGDGGQGGLGGDGGEGGEGGECFTAQQCADGNPCTLDGCFNGRCGYNDVDPDDDIACTVDSCDPVDFVIHEPIDSDCALGEICAVDTGCEPIGDGDQNGVVIISELDFDAARIEIHNATSSDVDVRGYVLENPTQTADIRAVDDLDASQGTAVVLGPGAFLVGMANPSDGVVPPDVDFVYGDPGGGFAVSAAGDVLGLYSEAGDLEDIVDFGQIHSDPDSDVPLDAFVVMAGVTSQLDDASLTAIANDDGSSWCLSFFPHEPVAGVRSRISDTLGEANGSCRAFVINELLYDYDSPGSGADEGQVFVEIAGPGGGLLTGVRLVGIEGSDGSEQSPDVTFGPARMPLDGLWVVADGDVDGGATLVPEADVVLAAGDPENGADAIRLESASAAGHVELA